MEWSEIISQVGVIGAILIALFVGGRALFKRLFDPETGILVKISNRHLAFVDAVEKNMEKQSSALEEQSLALATLLEMHADPSAPFSTVRTNKAIWHLVEAVKCLGSEVKGDNKRQLERHVEKAKEGLALQA